MIWDVPVTRTHHMRSAKLTILLVILASSNLPARAAPLRCDFRYAPPEWQASICLPDDPYKTLVDKSGELLYHYGRSRSREFATRVGVEVAEGRRLETARNSSRRACRWCGRHTRPPG